MILSMVLPEQIELVALKTNKVLLRQSLTSFDPLLVRADVCLFYEDFQDVSVPLLGGVEDGVQ